MTKSYIKGFEFFHDDVEKLEWIIAAIRVLTDPNGTEDDWDIDSTDPNYIALKTELQALPKLESIEADWETHCLSIADDGWGVVGWTWKNQWQKKNYKATKKDLKDLKDILTKYGYTTTPIEDDIFVYNDQ